MDKFAVILPAAGRSTRFGDPKQKKIYAELSGRAVWLRALDPFINRDDVAQTIVAINPEDRELFERRYGANVAFLNIRVIDGGAERSDTIARALDLVEPDCNYVAIHDAARPCLTPDLVEAVFATAKEHGAAILATPVADTLKRVDAEGQILETVPRAGLHGAQTPQVFRRDLILRAYANRASLGASAGVTDDAQLVEAIGHPCRVVEGSPMNIKITTAADLRLAEAILQSLPKPEAERPLHPFADESAAWGDLPKPKAKDLFK
jgi:2-C-methyl-D-erythritol 4-phosphate cytidylyltransferase